jgi:hypothetical protein
MTPPEESVVMPDRVAPVTCASIETAMDKVRRTANKLAEIFVSLRGPIAHLLNDHAVIVSRNFLLAFRGCYRRWRIEYLHRKGVKCFLALNT